MLGITFLFFIKSKIVCHIFLKFIFSICQFLISLYRFEIFLPTGAKVEFTPVLIFSPGYQVFAVAQRKNSDLSFLITDGKLKKWINF